MQNAPNQPILPVCARRQHFRELGAALERHHAAGASLQAVEQALLSEQLAALDRALEPGLARLNWTSLTISHFVEGVNKVRVSMGSGKRRLPSWLV